MPKLKVKFDSKEVAPTALQSYLGDDFSAEIWVGDNVAAETNPTLEASKNDILNEKKTLQTKYDNLLTTSATTATELNETKVALASKVGVPAEDIALLTEVKKYGSLDQVKTKLERYPTLEQDAKTLHNTQLFQASGFTNQTVFNDLINNPEKLKGVKELKIKDITENNITKKKTFAVKEDGSEVALLDYAKTSTEWIPYLGTLTDKASGGADWIAGQKPAGGGGGEGQKTLLQTVIEKQETAAKTAPNPLFPNRQAGA